MKKISLILITILVLGCSSDGGNQMASQPAPPEPATLTFPENNQECNEGIEVNSNQSKVTFMWMASSNTDSYEVMLTNLNNNSTTRHLSNTNQKEIILNKATPYSWHVISKSNSSSGTAQSATWKFYNAGDGIQTYAPFPAELIAPNMGAYFSSITSIDLVWSGSDVDGDIVGYDIYFDTVTPPVTLISSGQTNASIYTAVSAGNVYYWKVVTFDSEGNSSDSQVFEFRVD